MRFTIIREELLKSLNLVSRAVPAKTFIPSLMYIKIKLDDSGLTLIGSNETLAISSTLPIKKDDKEIIRNFRSGSILVQGRYFTEIVKKLSSYEITFEVLDNNIIEITNEKSSFQLNSANIEEYPNLEFDVKGTEFDVDRLEFINLISQTSFAAAQKENKAILIAVNLKGEDGKLVASALDSARLSQKEIPLESNINFNINIAARTLDEIVKMFDEGDKVHIIVSDNRVLFKFGSSIVSSNLVNGDFPIVKNFIPKSFNYKLVVNSNEFLSAIDRVLLLTNEKNTIKLSISQNEVIISSFSNEIGNASEKINNFEYSNDKFEIYFNGTYVLDGIRAIRSEEIILEFIAESKPFVIKKVNSDDIIELIVPVRNA